VLRDRVIFTGIVHDLTELKKAQESIVKLNKELERKVNERTYELENVVNEMLRANSRLKEEIIEREMAQKKLSEREIELEKSLAKEKELGELKSRFVSMASHEFRTPLATILSSASLISRYENAEQQPKREKHINRIKNAVKNLTGILNDFLSLSKLEEGIINVLPENIVLEELCDEVFDELQVILKSGQLLVKTKKGKRRNLFHDPRILKNILFNLISNAIKYSNPNSKIECNLEFLEDNVAVEIKDYGIGIPEDDKKYMFQRFFRAGNVTNIQGTGLGLTIVKRYIDIIGGDINFASTFGEGTSFFIKIPYNVNKD
jgi:signal transduction histidine kinase